MAYARCRVYLLPLLFILGWWYCGFAKPSTFSHAKVKLISTVPSKKAPLSDILSPLSRKELKQALEGDINLMSRLISEWDQDAQILETHGFITAERLSRRDYVKALLLGRTLRGKTQAPSPQKFLPQTWASASFLLALLPVEQIAALPPGFKRDKVLPIPELRGEYAEFIWKFKPTLAFCAPYSNPGIFQVLQAQNIPFHIAKPLTQIQDIFDELETVGLYVDKKEEAELMTLFMKAALLAIDNRAKLLHPYEKTFYLSWGNHFSYPTDNMITGQLVKRLHLNHELPTPSNLAWKVPLDRETLIKLNPSRLIIACENPKKFSLPEWNKPLEIALVEEALLESPDQYVVLAYFDLYEALQR